MYDYGKLVYLDNQKTGSTYVSLFLKNCCTLDHVASHKHSVVKSGFNPEAVYFSTVRHPIDLYVSLFQYGCENQGSTYKKLRQIGQLDLYESLPKWLEFVLDEKNASLFGSRYERVAPLGVGLLSYRAMSITLRHATGKVLPRPPEAKPTLSIRLEQLVKKALGMNKTVAPTPHKPQGIRMAKAKSYNHLIGIWNRNHIAQHIFLQEDLNVSLETFATETVPEFFNEGAVRAFLDHSERINSSKPRDAIEIPNELYQRIREKERFLFDKFYADRPHAPRIIIT